MGTRLYQALIGKLESGKAHNYSLPKQTLHNLKRFKEEEENHFHFLTRCLTELGADPSALIPSADTSAVSAMGLLQVVTDPRTTFAQSVQSILIAELTDHDSWALLYQLSLSMEFKSMSEDFIKALIEEQDHLDHIRRLYEYLIMAEAKVVA